MTKYLFLIRGGHAKELQESPEAMEVHVKKWKAWMRELADSGALADGLPLAAEGTIVSGGGNLLTDGPFAEGKEVVGGYLVINADSLAGAAEIAKGCPTHVYDGSVEVREILSMEY